jgi:hypothetical protein
MIFSAFASKSMTMICQWSDIKTTGTVFSGLTSKPVATIFSDLASKPMTTVFSQKFVFHPREVHILAWLDNTVVCTFF